MKNFEAAKNMCKGMIIGLANVIPGVSGGTMAVSMGIYDRLIHCITHFTIETKKSLMYLFPIAIGMGIAIIASAFGISYLFEVFPMQTTLFFGGLIFGSLPAVCKKIKGKSVKPGHIVCAIIFFAIVIEMALLNGTASRTMIIDISFTQVIILFLVGVIAAGTMVIPGISGSMMLLLLGYYNPILDTIQQFTKALLSFEWEMLIETLFVLVPFSIGVLFGIAAIARLIEVIFHKFPVYAYWSIIGLLLASPEAVILVGELPEFTVSNVLTGILTFVIGYRISEKLGESNGA